MKDNGTLFLERILEETKKMSSEEFMIFYNKHYEKKEEKIVRKLATVQKILEVQPIKGADKIERVKVLGWWLVSSKGDFKVDDLCIYFEIDSVLPVQKKYEFLRNMSYVNKDWIEGFRLKTVRFRKQLSQGLVLALPIEYKGLPIGEDLTERLGVKLWDPPISLYMRGEIKGDLPSFIPKIAPERVQNIFDLFKNKYDEFECSTKLDGTNCTTYFKEGNIGVCSHRLEWELNEENYLENVYVGASLKVQEVLKKLRRNLAIQGEIIGPSVQGNVEKCPSLEFRIFNIFDLDTRKYLLPSERLEFIEQQGLLSVPIPDSSNFPFKGSLEQLLAYVESLPGIYTKKAEGAVFKLVKDPRISFKVINNSLLEVE